MDKVFIVTSGSYSDYRIRAIFKDEDNAERYKNLLSDANEIEEYELSDDNIIEPRYYVHCTYGVYDIHFPKDSYLYSIGRMMSEKYKYELKIDRTNSLDDTGFGEHTHYSDFGGLSLRRSLVKYPESNVDYDALEAKYLKICQDYAAIVEYEKANGATDKQIGELLSKK